ncbi:MAG: hypothetical protein R3Y64_06920 [Peptostreptococcaceae bacterium]
MGALLKSKYNSTGIRCVDACLQYGEVRYKADDSTPSKIEIPYDKYDDAIAEFEDRINEGMSNNIRPSEIFRRGNCDYNQVKCFADESKIRGLDYFPMDGSIDCDNELGISGIIEYALSRWNGNDRRAAIKMGILRGLTINGEDFVKAMRIDNAMDESKCMTFARSASTTQGFGEQPLYKMEAFDLGGEIYKVMKEKKGVNIKDMTFDKVKDNLDFKEVGILLLATILTFAILQIVTGFGSLFSNIILYGILSILISSTVGFICLKTYKSARNKHAASSNEEIISVFNEALEKQIYQYMLTQNEMKLILKNITSGEIYKLIEEMKGSVNKRSSVNIIMEKETRFILDARATVTIPTLEEVRGIFTDMVSEYQGTLSKNYNVKTVESEPALSDN